MHMQSNSVSFQRISLREIIPAMFVAASIAAAPARSEVIPMPAEGDLIGGVRYVTTKNEDTLIEIARQYSVGQDEMEMANPKIDRWTPGEGTKVLLPKRYILPDAPRTGIVVNIPEMRLYYYPGGRAAAAPQKTKGAAASVGERPASRPSQIITYPVSLGRMDWNTPLGVTRIASKVKDPVWVPPASIKREHAAEGEILPDVVPAGPHNPLGAYAMRLGVSGYLIHGVDIDKAYGIGMRVTHGCIRMYPEDVENLFPQVNVGTQVNLVNQSVKMGWSGGTLYAEVHVPLDEEKNLTADLMREARARLAKITAKQPVNVDFSVLQAEIAKPTGLPVAIGSLSGSLPAASAPIEANRDVPPPAEPSELPHRDSAPRSSVTATPSAAPVYPAEAGSEPVQSRARGSIPPVDDDSPVGDAANTSAPEPIDAAPAEDDSAAVEPVPADDPVDAASSSAAVESEEVRPIEPQAYPSQVEPAPVYPEEPGPDDAAAPASQDERRGAIY